MKLKQILSVAILLLGGMAGKAQYKADKTNLKSRLDFIGHLELSNDSLGQISIHQDFRVRELLKRDKEINSSNPGFTGYRIQIFSGRSFEKEKAFALKAEFEELFPDVRAFVKYQAPDFRVMVGNFRTKLESIYLYQFIKGKYPHCYPVRTRILFSDLEVVEEMIPENDTVTEQE